MIARRLDQLITHERGALRWYFGWLIGTATLGLLLLTWAAVGPDQTAERVVKGIGSSIFLAACQAPIAQIMRRRDRIRALRILHSEARTVRGEQGEIDEIRDQVKQLLSAMIGVDGD